MDVGFKQIPRGSIATLVMAWALCMPPATSAASEPDFRDDLNPFFDLFGADRANVDRAFRSIDSSVKECFAFRRVGYFGATI